MDDLIRRSELLSVFKRWERVPDYNDAERHIIKAAIYETASIPAVDAVEVRHGEWEYTGKTDEWYGPVFRCKACGGEMIGNPTFCCDCGARMDGEEEHNAPD